MDSLFYIVLEMLKLRLTVLKNCTENVFTDEDFIELKRLCNDFKLNDDERNERIKHIEDSLVKYGENSAYN